MQTGAESQISVSVAFQRISNPWVPGLEVLEVLEDWKDSKDWKTGVQGLTRRGARRIFMKINVFAREVLKF